MKLSSVNAICISIMLLLSSVMLVTCADSVYAQATVPAKYFAIYYTVTAGGSSYIKAGNYMYNIGGNGGATVCYIPDLNSTTFVDGSTYISYTWAPTDIIPYAVDDRLFLFIRSLSDIHADPGVQTTYCSEVNPANSTTLTPTFGGPSEMPFNFYCSHNFAVVDNSLYFVEDLWYDTSPSRNIHGMGLNIVNLTSGAETQLLAATDPDNYGSLVSAGGNLFRYEFANQTTSPGYVNFFLTINQIDLVTGKIAKGVQLFMPAGATGATLDNASYRDWSFSADENTFYIAALYSPSSNATSSQIRLWTIPLAEFVDNSIPNGPNSTAGPDYWFNVNQVALPLNDPGLGLVGTDACEGHVLLNMFNYTILYDQNANSYIIHPGFQPNAYILNGATNPEPIPSPSTSPFSPSTSSSSTSPSSSHSPSPSPTYSRSPSPSTSPTVSPLLPNGTLVLVAVGVIAIVSVALVALFVRRRKGAVSRFPLPPPPPAYDLRSRFVNGLSPNNFLAFFIS